LLSRKLLERLYLSLEERMRVLVLVLLLGLVGCPPRPRSNLQQEKFARRAAAVKLNCSGAEVLLDYANAEVVGDTTIYKGTACGRPIDVHCTAEKDPYYGETTSCTVYADAPSTAPGGEKN
jgi:hypothetical protein